MPRAFVAEVARYANQREQYVDHDEEDVEKTRVMHDVSVCIYSHWLCAKMS
jgi:hypothetical protein